MSKRSTSTLLADILQGAERIRNYTAGITYDEFISNSMITDAVVRNFEIIGEAANRLPDEFKNVHKQINWHKLRGFRNRIVHDYFGIDYQIVWTIKEEALAELIISVKKLLHENP